MTRDDAVHGNVYLPILSPAGRRECAFGRAGRVPLGQLLFAGKDNIHSLLGYLIQHGQRPSVVDGLDARVHHGGGGAGHGHGDEVQETHDG